MSRFDGCSNGQGPRQDRPAAGAPAVSSASPARGDFVAELVTAAAAADPVRAVKEVLRRWAGLKPYIRSAEPKGTRSADVAHELLAAHVGTRAAAAILRERCSLSARQARRVVRAAADMRGQTMAALTRSMWP